MAVAGRWSISVMFASCCAVVAGVVLVGWSVSSRVIVQVVPGAPIMTPLTAVCLLALALGCGLRAGRVGGRWGQRVGAGLGWLVAAVAAVVLFGYLTGLPIGIDRVLFVETVQRLKTTGRSAPHTAMTLVCLGAALGLLDARPPRYRPALWLSTAGATVSLTGAMGYVHRVAYLHSLDRVTGMAVHTAGCLLLLAASISTARPDRGLIHALTHPGPGRLLVRRIGPVLLLVPFAAGILTSGAARVTGAVGQALVTAVAAACMLVPIMVVGRVAQAIDAADRRIRDEREFSATVLHSLHAGVLVLDPTARVVEVNPRWCEQVGRPASQVLGATPPFPWWPPDQADQLSDRLARDMTHGGQTRMEHPIVRPDGSTATMLATLAPARASGGAPRVWVCTYTDITDLKRTEVALREHAAEVEAANRELADANQLKTDLMAMLTHEIAQPLGTIVGAADVLVCEGSDPPPDWPALVGRIERSGRRLSRMVSDMLLMFRLETHAVTARPHPVDLTDLVTGLLGELGSVDDIHTALSPDLNVHADPDHLRQIITNLITNARKYGRPPIEIRTTRAGDQVQLMVRDHGDGVPEHFVPHVFGRFTRSETVTSAPGIGLGLYITQQIASANNATIGYQSATPHGAIFSLALPVTPAGAVPVERAERTRSRTGVPSLD